MGWFRRILALLVVGAGLAFLGSARAQAPEVPRPSLKVHIAVTDSSDLVRAEEFLADGQWAEAVETIQRVSESEGDKLILLEEAGPARREGYARFIPVWRFCHMRLAEAHRTAPEALALYRRRVDPLARTWYERGAAQQDERLLSRVVDELFASSYGDDALDRLGQFALERGDFGRARQCWERISPLLRTPAGIPPRMAALSGRPLWLALRGVDLDEQWPQLRGPLTEPRFPPSWLAYPDTDLDLGDVRARLVLVSILEGSLERSRLELQVLRRLHPEAEGSIAGRRGRYVQLLSDLMQQSQRWQPIAQPSDWPTFGGSAARSRVADRAVDVAGAPRWRVTLDRMSDANELIGFGRPRIAEGADGLLSYHPLVVGDLVLWNDAASIRAHGLHESQPVWGSVGPGVGWQIFPARAERGAGRLERGMLFYPRRRHVGVPRFTMTAWGHKLFARLGDPVTGSRDDDAARAKRRRGVLVGLDLDRQGRLLPGFPLEPDGLRWEFEGAPVTDGARLYVAMRRSSASGAMPEVHVACFELATVAGDRLRRRWRVKICAAETPAGGRWDELTHLLLSLHEGTIYCNTNMGAVAALSAEDGRIQWIVRYPRSPLRPTDQDRSDWCYFRDLNPCVCYKDLVVVAPADCDRIFALDRATGQLLWENRLVDAVHLLGVAADQLVASGLYLYWIDAYGGGLIAQAPEPGSKRADGFARPEAAGYGRGILAGDDIYWPTREQILVYRQRLGRRRTADGRTVAAPQLVRAIQLARPDVRATGGNLVVADGVLLIAATDSLSAFSERPPVTRSGRADADLSFGN